MVRVVSERLGSGRVPDIVFMMGICQCVVTNQPV
jgi:hypothetical protein